jgi:hypothetical protein
MMVVTAMQLWLRGSAGVFVLLCCSAVSWALCSFRYFVRETQAELLMGPGMVAQIIFRFGPGSKDTNQALHRAFPGSSLLRNEKVSHDSRYGLK